MVSTFEITHAADTRACVARLSGDIDTAVVPELRHELEQNVDSGCSNFVLDLTGVTYIDSSALGLLVWLDRRVGPTDGRVMLAGANPDVSRILELSGLARLASSVSVSDDVATALGSLEVDAPLAEALWEHRIVIPADIARLAEVRDEVSEIVAPMGFADSSLFDIKVALGEALANAVRHGAPDRGGEVCVDVIAFSDRLVLEVADNGIGFDGVHSASDDLYAPSGRGIMFMRALMDRVEFEPAAGGGTIVRLVKHHASGAA
jgi:stage II sporulation protein AA (anti-sigma F factor antagonist)